MRLPWQVLIVVLAFTASCSTTKKVSEDDIKLEASVCTLLVVRQAMSDQKQNARARVREFSSRSLPDWATVENFHRLVSEDSNGGMYKALLSANKRNWEYRTPSNVSNMLVSDYLRSGQCWIEIVDARNGNYGGMYEGFKFILLGRPDSSSQDDANRRSEAYSRPEPAKPLIPAMSPELAWNLTQVSWLVGLVFSAMCGVKMSKSSGGGTLGSAFGWLVFLFVGMSSVCYGIVPVIVYFVKFKNIGKAESGADKYE